MFARVPTCSSCLLAFHGSGTQGTTQPVQKRRLCSSSNATHLLGRGASGCSSACALLGGATHCMRRGAGAGAARLVLRRTLARNFVACCSNIDSD